MCAKARCLVVIGWREEPDEEARRRDQEQWRGLTGVYSGFCGRLRHSSIGWSLSGLYLIPKCAQKDAERQRCAAPKGVWIKWRYKKLTHLRCHCHRSTGTNQDPGRTRCTGYPLFLELLVRFWVNELRWTCLLYSRKKLSLKVSDCKVN